MRDTKSWSTTKTAAVMMALGLAGACGQSLEQDRSALDEQENGGATLASFPARPDPSNPSRARIMPVNNPNKPPVNTAFAGLLSYYGGHVISNVKVEIVYWEPAGKAVNPTIKSGMGDWYRAVVDSPHMDWLSEYNTNITAVNGQQGTNQTIGRGTLDKEVTIAPSVTGTVVTDDQIQAELTKQIDSGKLPAPDANTYYAFYFPPGVTVDMGGARSCSTFCAYHGTHAYQGKNTYYAVMPDISGCLAGCGGGATLFNAVSYASSHELIEAVTDAEVGVATTVGPPLAWYNQQQGEIGDICNQQSGPLPGTNYVVQAEYSNCEGKCIVTRSAGATCGGGGGSVSASITAPSNNATVSGTVTVSATAATTFSGKTITKVDFFRNGALIGTDATAPYSITWDTTTVPNTGSTLSAKATDSGGNSGSSSNVAVTVNNATGGTVSAAITSPSAGATLTGTVTLSATAATTFSGKTVSKVEFFRDGALIGSDATAPYSITWDTTTSTNGGHSLTAKATDSGNNAGTSGAVSVSVSNQMGGCASASESEPNNAFTTANAQSGTCVTVAGTNGAATDTDFFAIDVPAGKTLKVTMTPAADADFDLYVYNSAQGLIGKSENTTGAADAVTVQNTGTQTYRRYVEVRYYDGARATGNAYSVKIQLQ